MKKIIVTLLAAFCLAAGSFAQVKKPAKPAAPHVVKPAAPIKKDGTPDMRFKVNKEAAKPAGPLKKDGTPDMRFKANKPAPPKPPLKKKP